MLTVSIHGIKIHAYIGLYPDEKKTGNNFEIDVDLFIKTNEDQAFPFADYSTVYNIACEIMRKPGDLIESYVKEIHTSLKRYFPEAQKIKVAVRKLQPPLAGDVRYAQVSYEA